MAKNQTISLPVEQHEAAVEQSKDANSETPQPQTTDPAVQRTPKQTASAVDKVASPTTPNARSPANTVKTATPPKPVVPAVPKLPSKTTPKQAAADAEKLAAAEDETTAQNPDPSIIVAEDDATGEEPASAPAPAQKPTSWANLFARRQQQAAAANGASPASSVSGDVPNGNGATSTFASKSSSSVAEAIRAYKVNSGGKTSYIEPRGLINTGNMCYMNSILQVLMFCIPFYDLLDQVSKRAAHSFKSETPLIDAMIMFMHEFKVQKSADSIEALRKSLRGEDLEKFGEPFTPEFVYEAIRQLPRFSSMRRGHQQDAEEFLGFLLQALDEECLHVMGGAQSLASAQSDAGSTHGEANTDDWLEVGRKQKAAVSRSSGTNAPTPINRIFGGLLRSEFRVPGSKDSITTEPYQPLQLDIGAPDINSVSDALRGITRTERIEGNFASSRGGQSSATKQVFIETLPPVLILHLKRFKFDAEVNGTVKIWKKIDYPLDLEIPREVLSRQKRATIGNGAMPRYRLISVVYHHGKNASGGHYTVDVRRQDGQDWLRMDDTILRRVRSEDVAESGSEKENKANNEREAAAATNPAANRFGAIVDEEDDNDEDEWKQVTASSKDTKRWSNLVNGTGATATKSKHHKESVKDNKVAYLLFYQRV